MQMLTKSGIPPSLEKHMIRRFVYKNYAKLGETDAKKQWPFVYVIKLPLPTTSCLQHYNFHVSYYVNVPRGNSKVMACIIERPFHSL